MLSKPNHRTGRTLPALLAVALSTLATGAMLLPSSGYAATPAQVTTTPKLTLGDLVRAGKRDSVLAAITSPDVNVNEQAPDGSTALMWATFNVDLDNTFFYGNLSSSKHSRIRTVDETVFA